MGKSPKILIFDIETAGVQGLCADRGFVVVFGWMWLGEDKAHTMTIAEHPGKHLHDDTHLLKRAVEILNKADGSVAHFGSKFDKPYLQARLLQAGLPPISNNKLTDTCLLARTHLRLSSNRLANLANFLKLKNRKMEKGNGWPDWWMKALIGDKTAIRKMAVYCAKDVLCLRDIYLKMRHIIPRRYLPINESIGEKLWTCAGCGGHRKNDHGYYFSDMKRWRRSQCQTCGRWDRSKKADAEVPRV